MNAHYRETAHPQTTLSAYCVKLCGSGIQQEAHRAQTVLDWPDRETEQHQEQGAELNDDRVEDSTASQASSACDERTAR